MASPAWKRRPAPIDRWQSASPSSRSTIGRLGSRFRLPHGQAAISPAARLHQRAPAAIPGETRLLVLYWAGFVMVFFTFSTSPAVLLHADLSGRRAAPRVTHCSDGERLAWRSSTRRITWARMVSSARFVEQTSITPFPVIVPGEDRGSRFLGNRQTPAGYGRLFDVTGAPNDGAVKSNSFSGVNPKDSPYRNVRRGNFPECSI